ncbi:hypothetical protein A7981_05750 [Methylovorus sp. MM2]|uniref:hypothetical protein n=1 Tax=Methylovorus sp. MM2 TaxID=1848038 RepID=UPI0007DF1187|nr:hypothetical protein [Methylovorus sp. MM2]OAM52937.1 hypothetical protein A7981_05750 [Methylovorus sp. MM2]
MSQRYRVSQYAYVTVYVDADSPEEACRLIADRYIELKATCSGEELEADLSDCMGFDVDEADNPNSESDTLYEGKDF